ncbi:MAG: Na/Pi cotransporter family protein [Pigmentiphaga sp.]
MLEIVFPLAGGIGLFLLGMMLLSQGLTGFAGESLRLALMRFTGTPAKAFASGTVVTLLIQSSTATTLTLIGFVSAGLIPFSQAVGVVMGASLGTTGTGWMVAGLGLKIDLGFYTLPLIGMGALMRLLARGRWSSLGMALAGFGTLFVGLGQLQEGMRGVTEWFDLAALPVGGLWAHLLVMLIGVLLTTVLQSSTAAVATILTALHAGAINFEQASALVIGAAIGTTFTGALAAIGGTTPAKRTALAHILFNLATGLIAVAMLPGFLALIGWGQERLGLEAGALSLALFHTLFIGLGVVLFLPWAQGFARLIERLLPERRPHLASHLDDTLLEVPEVALGATAGALVEIAQRTYRTQRQLLAEDHDAEHRLGFEEAVQALERAGAFFARIPPAIAGTLLPQRLALMHAMDHLQRLQSRLQAPMLASVARVDPICQRAMTYNDEMLRLADNGLASRDQDGWLARIEHDAHLLMRLHEEARSELLREGGQGERSVADSLRIADTLRWLERSGQHVWRSAHYLQQALTDAGIKEGQELRASA